nr:hypothetical protein [Pseudenhygromyxa sp. WMMC2535]
MTGKWISVSGSHFEDNLDSAIWALHARVTWSTFINNHSDKQGGAISMESAQIEAGLFLRDSLFIGNHSELHGGAVSGTNLEIERCRFIANDAELRGGAVAQFGFGIPNFIRDSEFIDNVAGLQGGGVYGAPSIIRSTFTGNLAGGEPNGLDSGNLMQFPSLTASVFWPDSVRGSAPDEIPVTVTDSCITPSADNFVDLQGSSLLLVESPFEADDLDEDGLLELYLDPLGPCVDLAALPPEPEEDELDWSTATTQLSQCTDSGLLDAGMHYTPLGDVGPC